MRPLLKAGLTGGIASGKSTVSGFLREEGASVIDADRLAHALMQPGGSAYRPVVDRFGEKILEPDGTISRPRLGDIVFADPAALADLNSIVHPAVRHEMQLLIALEREYGDAPVVVFDAALLVESGGHRAMDKLIVLRCSVETQIRRLMARSGMTDREAAKRVAAQAPLEEKLALADYIINTDTALVETERQARTVYASLLVDLEHIRNDRGETTPFREP